MAVADLIGEELDENTMAEAGELLTIAYGKEYSEDKLNLLYTMCLEDNWSAKRFMDTLKWLIKTKPWPEWKIADFFEAPMQKLHPYLWAAEQWAKGIKNLKMYKIIGDQVYFALPTDEIPLPEWKPEPAAFVAPTPEEAPPETHAEILAGLSGPLQVAKDIL